MKLKSLHSLFKFIGYYEKEQEQFCSVHTKHYMLFQFYTRTLKKEIEEWRNKRTKDGKMKFLTEEQIWHILTEVTTALDYLKSIDCPHGDISPRTIHLSEPIQNDSKFPTTKIYNNVLLNSLEAPYIQNYSSSYNKMLTSIFQSYDGLHKNEEERRKYDSISDNRTSDLGLNNPLRAPKDSGIYTLAQKEKLLEKLRTIYKAPLSPALLDCIKYKKMSPEHDPYKSDIFSLGVTLICLCTLDRFERFYDYEKYTFKFDYAKSNFRRMARIGYSSQLISLIQSMLELEECARVDISGIFEMIRFKKFSMEIATNGNQIQKQMLKNAFETNGSLKARFTMSEATSHGNFKDPFLRCQSSFTPERSYFHDLIVNKRASKSPYNGPPNGPSNNHQLKQQQPRVSRISKVSGNISCSQRSRTTSPIPKRVSQQPMINHNLDLLDDSSKIEDDNLGSSLKDNIENMKQRSKSISNFTRMHRRSKSGINIGHKKQQSKKKRSEIFNDNEDFHINDYLRERNQKIPNKPQRDISGTSREVRSSSARTIIGTQKVRKRSISPLMRRFGFNKKKKNEQIQRVQSISSVSILNQPSFETASPAPQKYEPAKTKSKKSVIEMSIQFSKLSSQRATINPPPLPGKENFFDSGLEDTLTKSKSLNQSFGPLNNFKQRSSDNLQKNLSMNALDELKVKQPVMTQQVQNPIYTPMTPIAEEFSPNSYLQQHQKDRSFQPLPVSFSQPQPFYPQTQNNHQHQFAHHHIQAPASLKQNTRIISYAPSAFSHQPQQPQPSIILKQERMDPPLDYTPQQIQQNLTYSHENFNQHLRHRLDNLVTTPSHQIQKTPQISTFIDQKSQKLNKIIQNISPIQNSPMNNPVKNQVKISNITPSISTSQSTKMTRRKVVQRQSNHPQKPQQQPSTIRNPHKTPKYMVESKSVDYIFNSMYSQHSRGSVFQNSLINKMNNAPQTNQFEPEQKPNNRVCNKRVQRKSQLSNLKGIPPIIRSKSVIFKGKNSIPESTIYSPLKNQPQTSAEKKTSLGIVKVERKSVMENNTTSVNHSNQKQHLINVLKLSSYKKNSTLPKNSKIEPDPASTILPRSQSFLAKKATFLQQELNHIARELVTPVSRPSNESEAQASLELKKPQVRNSNATYCSFGDPNLNLQIGNSGEKAVTNFVSFQNIEAGIPEEKQQLFHQVTPQYYSSAQYGKNLKQQILENRLSDRASTQEDTLFQKKEEKTSVNFNSPGHKELIRPHPKFESKQKKDTTRRVHETESEKKISQDLDKLYSNYQSSKESQLSGNSQVQITQETENKENAPPPNELSMYKSPKLNQIHHMNSDYNLQTKHKVSQEVDRKIEFNVETSIHKSQHLIESSAFQPQNVNPVSHTKLLRINLNSLDAKEVIHIKSSQEHGQTDVSQESLAKTETESDFPLLTKFSKQSNTLSKRSQQFTSQKKNSQDPFKTENPTLTNISKTEKSIYTSMNMTECEKKFYTSPLHEDDDLRSINQASKLLDNHPKAFDVQQQQMQSKSQERSTYTPHTVSKKQLSKPNSMITDKVKTSTRYTADELLSHRKNQNEDEQKDIKKEISNIFSSGKKQKVIENYDSHNLGEALKSQNETPTQQKGQVESSFHNVKSSLKTLNTNGGLLDSFMLKGCVQEKENKQHKTQEKKGNQHLNHSKNRLTVSNPHVVQSSWEGKDSKLIPKNPQVVFDSCDQGILTMSNSNPSHQNCRLSSNVHLPIQQPQVKLSKAPSYKIMVNPHNGVVSYEPNSPIEEDKENSVSQSNRSQQKLLISTAQEIESEKTQKQIMTQDIQKSMEDEAMTPQKHLVIDLPELKSTSDSGSKDYSKVVALFNRR